MNPFKTTRAQKKGSMPIPNPNPNYKPREKFRPWPPGAKPLYARIHSWSVAARVGYIDHKNKGKPSETVVVKLGAISVKNTDALNGSWLEYYENGIEEDREYRPKNGNKPLRTLRSGACRVITAAIAIARLDASDTKQT